MLYLVLVSVIWSLSFGLFKTRLASLDPNLTAFLRLVLALALFLPWLRLGRIPPRARLVFSAIGMLQYGLMYLLLNRSFQYLNGWQVALMTLLSPIYIVLFDSIGRRRIDYAFLLAAALAVGGAAIAMWQKGGILPRSLWGCFLVQGADMSFALGQLLYRSARRKYPEPRDHQLYALPYAGAVLVTVGATIVFGNFSQLVTIAPAQWGAIAYLGLVASGLAFFWWNLGATRVSTGPLAVMNNLKAPLAVAASLTLFGESAGDWPRLIIGAAIMACAAYLAQRRAQAAPRQD